MTTDAPLPRGADTPLPTDDGPPTVGDAIRALERQLTFWRRCAMTGAALLAAALMIILIGGGALLAIASSSADGADDARRAADAARDSSESNHEVLNIIKEQTGPAAVARQRSALQNLLSTADCNVRIAVHDALSDVAQVRLPPDYLKGCPPTRTIPNTEETP